MVTLKECLAEAKAQGRAVGHFNTSNLEGFWAIVRAAQELQQPVIVGVSEGERDFIGIHQIVALVQSVRASSSTPIFLNADHTYSFERVKEAIDAGFDSVIFDGAKLSLTENITLAKQCVEYAKAQSRPVLVEGELGYIGQSSEVIRDVPSGVRFDADHLTSVAEAQKFVTETGVDLLAPAVGNMHGMLADRPDPALNIARIKELAAAVAAPLVLHGASGNSDEDVRAAVAAGINLIHVNTELRVAYRDALKLALQENPEEVAPYKIAKGAVVAMQKVVEKKLRLFAGL